MRVRKIIKRDDTEAFHAGTFTFGAFLLALPIEGNVGMSTHETAERIADQRDGRRTTILIAPNSSSAVAAGYHSNYLLFSER